MCPKQIEVNVKMNDVEYHTKGVKLKTPFHCTRLKKKKKKSLTLKWPGKGCSFFLYEFCDVVIAIG